MVLDAPLNIPTNEITSFPECNETCSYTFDYGSSTTVVEHNENYFKFTYETSNRIQSTYNNTQLQVQEIRLYTPSLTRYNGEPAEFELLIHHIDTQGQGLNVMVSVPIRVEDSPPRSNALSFFEAILPHLPSEANNPVPINQTFSLNDFVPYQSYAFAKTTLPYPPNNGEYTSLFFFPTNGSPIISRMVAEQLAQVLTSPEVSPDSTDVSIDQMYYNKNGSTHPDENTGDDDIWIDCQPTGDSLIPEDELAREQGLTPPDVPFRERVEKFFEKHEWLFYTLISFVGILFMLLLFYVGKKVFEMVKERRASRALSATSNTASSTTSATT